MNHFSMRTIAAAAGGIILLIVLLAANPLSYNDSGFRTHVQTLSGKEFIQFEPGVYWAGVWATTTEYPDVITVQFGEEDQRQEDVTFFAAPHGVRFNDGTKADAVGHTVRWALPNDETAMIKVHKHARSARRLAAIILAKAQKECMNYATQLMTSEFHYSGGQSQLKEDFVFQLENGQYLLDQTEEWVTDTSGERTKVYVKKKRRDANGELVLSKSDIHEYGITPASVSIDLFDYEPIVDERMKKKIELAMQEANSKQALLTAQQEAVTAEMEGRKKIAVTRANEEASKIEAVIRAEKATAVAAEEAKKAKFVAAKVKAEKEAEAAANRALVNAGLTPEKRAIIDKETSIGVAAELAKVKFPEIMIFGGGQDGGPLNPFDAVGLQSLMDIQNRIKKSTTSN